ncbi:BrnA antitoxin family protein [Pseudomonas sp. PDM26]|uniref:BrnA antitoxin family protein n=1 Tax=Pseudomonas sp. PDM26 TaxID=2854766 RepID=UPI001C48ACF8|nr:BrnA antitoxin family protein [Pseudomonas sp. PDM26]MBV7546198.1 BrnA antitoxin family protein [Pseudomonas sp. PDM26]
MKDEYDFSNARRGAVVPAKGKTRITIMLDDAVIEAARALAEKEGYGYQTAINNTLRRALLNEGKTTHLKQTLTPAELKGLEQKLAEALREIQRVMEPSVRL